MPTFATLFSERREALRDFWAVYETQQGPMRELTLESLRAHPVFGPMIAAMTREQMDQQNAQSIEQLRRGCLDGDWGPYEANLEAQGTMYAQMRVPFSSWYDVMRIVNRVLVPALVAAYGAQPARLSCALGVMSDLFDKAMAGIAERYIEAKEEDRFRVLVDAVRDYAIFMLDKDGRVASWNSGAEALKGYTPAEIIGKSIEVFYLPEERATKPRLELETAFRTGRYAEEGWRLRKDGTRFWASVVLTAIRDATGAVVAFAKVTRDLTERKLVEDQLRASEENVTTTLQSIGDGVISTDARGAIVRMNPVAEALTGYGIDEARGRPFTEVFNIINELTGKPAVNPIERVLREGTVVGLANHTALIAKDGVSRPIADSAAPIRGSNGDLTGVVLVFRDMTQEHAAAQAIREANAFLDSIVENLPHMVFVKDARDLRFVRFNKAGEELLGTPREDLIGKSDFDFFPKEQAESFVARDREVLVKKTLTDIAEEPIETKSGPRWLHTKKIPILDDKGAPRYLLGISEDITERRKMVEQVHRMNEELERRVVERTAALHESEERLRHSQKIDAIGRLAGGVAHDFNNLLSVILSYGEMLSTELPKESELQTEVGEIRRAAQRAADLTRQLLAFSRQQVLAPKVTDLNIVITGMDRMLSRLIGEDIEVRTRTVADLSMVMVDPSQIEQVVMNLVVNARDAMPRGGMLTLETANVDLDETYAAHHVGVTAGPHVMLAVTDNGIGMDKATKERIFEPFFTTKPTGKGTGLGLSTVFGIVKQSGGHIWVYSEEGTGTTFKIYFPRAEHKVHKSSSTLRVSVPRGKETILLVEDEEQVRTLAKTVLQRQGYDVVVAESGPTALAMLTKDERAIDLLLTDVVMPKMSGRELAERLVALRPKTKVLFMSGYTDDTIVHHGVLDSGISFLQKPITPDTLARKVRAVLDGTEQSRVTERDD